MKRWLKLYTSEWIEGSIRIDLTPAERSVWADLLAMAALSRREGYIERSQGIPYTIPELADRFVVSAELVQTTVTKCISEGRITLDGSNTIQITNWAKYQAVSEIRDRAKPNVTMSPEDKEAGQQAAAARLAYLHPDAAKRGIAHREIEKVANKIGKGG